MSNGVRGRSMELTSAERRRRPGRSAVPTSQLRIFFPPATLGLTNYNSAFNVNYKFSTTPWWWEPTVGFSYTSTVWDESAHALAFQDGHTLRIQGGVRVGTSFDWNGVTVEPTLAAMAYSDVEIRGGTVAVAVGQLIAPTDEGKIFGQGIAKLNFIWNRNLSSYVEGEVRG